MKARNLVICLTCWRLFILIETYKNLNQHDDETISFMTFLFLLFSHSSVVWFIISIWLEIDYSVNAHFEYASM